MKKMEKKNRRINREKAERNIAQPDEEGGINRKAKNAGKCW